MRWGVRREVGSNGLVISGGKMPGSSGLVGKASKDYEKGMGTTHRTSNRAASRYASKIEKNKNVVKNEHKLMGNILTRLEFGKDIIDYKKLNNKDVVKHIDEVLKEYSKKTVPITFKEAEKEKSQMGLIFAEALLVALLTTP